MKKRKSFLIFIVSLFVFCSIGNTNFPVLAEENDDLIKVVNYTGDASFSLYTSEDGALYAMGSNSLGQLGFVSDSAGSKDVYVPTQIGNIPTMAMLTTSARHVVGISDDGRVYVWGNNAYGQLGIYGAESYVRKYLEKAENLHVYVAGRDVSTPMEVVFDSDVRIVEAAASINNTFFLDENGNVWAVGLNEFGQLGIGREANALDFESNPVMVKDPSGVGVLSNIKKIACADTTVYALSNEGVLYAWGSDFYGLLGDGDSNNNGRNYLRANLPVEVKIGNELQSKPVIDIKAKGRISFIQTEDNSLYFLGFNEYGQAANENLYIGQKIYGPYEVNFFKDNQIEIKQLALSGTSCFVLSEDGTLYSWGGNGGDGYLGLGEYANIPNEIKPSANPMNEVIVPTKIVFEDDVAIEQILGTAGVRTFVMDKTGVVWCWGNNAYGQLGYRSETGELLYKSSSTPVKCELGRSGVFAPSLSQKNYLRFPIIFICAVVGVLIIWIVYSSFKTKQALKLEAEYDVAARKRYESLFTEKVKKFVVKLKDKITKKECN